MLKLKKGDRTVLLNHPAIMGILNVTPDSFSDGGKFLGFDQALRHTEAMIEAGADIIDIGGESTRPGADDVSEQIELDRTLPIIEAIVSRFDTVISLDTSKPSVMREGAAAGVGILNDIRALREPGSLETAAATGLPVCLMHMQGQPRSMQHAPEYVDVLTEVTQFLVDRRQICINAGIDASQIILDPGFGFGKNLSHNLALLNGLEVLCAKAPVLIGLSRKRMFGQILRCDSVSRVVASVTAAILCVQKGASIVRVHDVQETAQALDVYRAVNEQ
ncbi:dihydropteroate synthase [Granulosicoccus sp.]|nr:dihydropteroate synthase [Granulosicoccus sp.]MDB4223100.1 dihydropteroate synthase [Granulosicoccus sp.]